MYICLPLRFISLQYTEIQITKLILARYDQYLALNINQQCKTTENPGLFFSFIFKQSESMLTQTDKAGVSLQQNPGKQ